MPRDGAPNCYFDMLDKLESQICGTVRLSLVDTLEPLAHYQSIASVSLLNWYYFGRCSF